MPSKRRSFDGSWIRQARDEVGLDQSRLAELAGVSRRSLAAYERGETGIPPPKRVAIEQALHNRRIELSRVDESEELVRQLTSRVRTLEVLILRLIDLVEEDLKKHNNTGPPRQTPGGTRELENDPQRRRGRAAPVD